MSGSTEPAALAWKRALTEALVPPELHHRYHTSVYFKACIDTLAGMLPAWVVGLDETSAAEDREMEGAVEALRRWPTTTQTGPWNPTSGAGS